MKRYHPLVLQRLDISIPGLRVRQFALHRHLPETTGVTLHAHSFCQCLLYLSGRGVQQIGKMAHPVEAGSAVFLPPRHQHAFRREANRRPLCLVLDFEWRGAGLRSPRVARLPASSLHEVRQQLARIALRQREPSALSPLQLSVALLGLLEGLLTGLGLQPQHRGNAPAPITRKVQGLLAAPSAASVPLTALAQQVGYQQDYLNRLLKRHAGLTLGQLRARTRLARAHQLLRRTNCIADVATAVGFDDPNYFARWFRKHTGVSPSRWRQEAALT